MKIYRTIAFFVSIMWSFLAFDSFCASKKIIREVNANDVLSLEQELKGDSDNTIILQALGRYYFRSDNINAARKCGNRLLEIAKKNGDREFSEMWGRYILGAIQTSLGETKDAIMNLEIARSIAEAQENDDALSLIYNTLGLFYMFNNNDPFTATNFYYKAIEAARKEKNLHREAPLLANLAAAYLTMEDPSGLRIAEQAVEMSEKYDPEFSIKPRIILAETYILADSTDKAWKMLETIRSKEPEPVIENFSSILKYIEALLSEKEGRLDDAIKTYRILLSENSDDPSWISSVSLDLAEALEKKGLYSEGAEILERALTNSRKAQVHIHSSKVMKALVSMYAKAGQKDNAIAMCKEYMAYSDSLYTIGHHRTLQENRIRDEVYSKEREIDEQKLQLASKNHKITIMAIGLGLLTVLLIFGLTAYRKRERLYKTIVARNSEFLKRDKFLTEEIEHLRSRNDEQKLQNISESTNPIIHKSEDPNKELMERFTSYMENDNGYADPQITIASVAKELGTNRTYLSKAINAATGKTFLQIINEYRMRRAVELISDKDSDIPLKQLAADLGYNSMSTFYTSFHNYTGMTPAKYRDHIRRMNVDSM